MTSAERMKAQRDLERCVAKIIAKGWSLESLSTMDESAEPFRATICLKIEGLDYVSKGVM